MAALSPFRAALVVAMLCASGAPSPAAAAATEADPPARTEAERCKAGAALAEWSPQTAICFRFGAYLWAESYFNTYSDYPSGNDRTYGVGTLGLKAHTITQTELGPLRAYVNVRFRGRSANPWSDGPQSFTFSPWDAFIDFAGFTFGHQGSRFDFYSNANVIGTDPATVGDSQQLLLLAYTLRFGGGWSATFSLEAPWGRQAGVNPARATALAAFNQRAAKPDMVVAIAHRAAWGELQLSGALHEVRAKTFAGPAQGYYGASTPAMWGYALQVGVVFDLPQVAPGDSLFLQTAVTRGATSYLGLVNASGDFSPPDAYIRADGGFSPVTGWNVTAQYLHNWTHQWSSAFFGGFAQFYINDPLARFTWGASGGQNLNLGANVVWTPVSGFSVAVQYDFNVYRATQYRNTGMGLPRASQEAHQILLMAQQRF
ncbi:porin [Camelimonas abortus]|uniref:Porin n=1 Tax=Camelimonas abortus TaxID=1017184 RepID=A0ABV7LGP1_9HYPH